ncbi:hypothetical protein CANINC_000641 [Pichia inconspicua]|uniref:Serine/threonine-protein phosphatase n=1 Tax=Pichia inconspicua TaxID=52247 RepID=A0A4T0X5W3_9ASCO|nr:hypothetical protein CANINC_000641 [[Candida] inconspicua]
MEKEEAYIHYKGLGNDAFKGQHYPEAIKHYTKAIEVLENESEEENPDIINENLDNVAAHTHKHAHALAILYSNRAQTQLKLENYGLAIQDCTKSIEHDALFVKSLYRRAVAHYAIRELDSALKDLKEARKISPNDSKIKSLSGQISGELRKLKFEAAIDIVEKSIFESISWDGIEGDLKVEQTGKGDVKIVSGLNQEFITKMVDSFRNDQNLNKNDAFAIVAAANTIFKREKSMVEIGFEKDDNNEDHIKLNDVEIITVCGDTHGQFYDVLNIFKTFGKVDSKHAYLFNGDFVDRGSWGCEVALLLYALKVLFPTRIFINRGNHETDDMNSVYGFTDECKFKYGEKLFKCFSESFGNLPYSTLINKEYLVMHGGLFSDDTISLQDIKKINRFKQVHGQPPKTGIEMELIWTDPQPQEGRSLSKRGIGMQFGPDITAKFCERNNLKGILRSHEVRQNGYEWEHNGLLCTVFSAPNYCDVQGNLGGVVNFYRDGKMECKNFSAVPHPDVPPMKYTKNQYGF